MNQKMKMLLAVMLAVCTVFTGVLAGCKKVESNETTGTTEPSGAASGEQTEPTRKPGVYTVTILPSAHGTVTADCTEAKPGEIVTLTVTPEDGYELSSLTVNGAESQETFTMPQEDVSVLARFALIAEETEPEKPTVVYPSGNFFGSAGGYHSSTALNMKTDKGENPYLVMDANKSTPLYAYVKGVNTQRFALGMQVQVTGIRSDEGYPKFGLMTNDGKEMVKFYLDMTTEKQVNAVGAVHQKTGKDDDWAGQTPWPLQNPLNMESSTVFLTLLRDGNTYYYYIDGQLVATDSNLSDRKAATGIFSFGTCLKVTDYAIVTEGEELDTALETARADAESFNGIGLSQCFFTQDGEGYSLTTDSDAQHLVDDVLVGGRVMRECYYSLKGKLTLTDADAWGQARVLISNDPNNEHVIALEKVTDNAYQIFTMSKAGEEGWNDWRLISHCEINGNRNSIDFEIIVCDAKVLFLVDDKICYESSRVSMTESTLKFAGCNVATTTVQNLSLEVFPDAAAVTEYAAEKPRAEYENRFAGRMDSLYNEYIVENGCAGKGGTLIFGDSNLDFWGTWEQDTGLAKYVNGYNLGIGGSSILDWLNAYDRMIVPFGADRFIILAGGNDVDVWGYSGEESIQRLQALFEKIHADHPDAEIYYIYTTPSPSAYENGVYKNAKLGALISGAKTLCESLDYVQGIDMFDAMTTADKQNSNESLFAADKLHMSDAGYKVFSDRLYEIIFRGESFGAANGYKTSNGVDLTADKGNNASITFFGGAPQYAYTHNVFANKLVFETQINVKSVLNNDGWPKFGVMVNGSSEMVKFFVDMTPAMTATHVGVVYQPTGGGDDWANSRSCQVPGMVFTGSDTIELKLVRDGRAYYFYVNDVLVMYDEEGFKDEKCAVGIFSFNTALTASGYSVVTGNAAGSAIETAKTQAAALTKLGLSCNWFADKGNGAFVLTTNSNAEHKVDDLTRGGSSMREKYYSVKGKLTLTNAGDWAQARILVSADPSNEYFIALERTNSGKFQIFTMSKANQSGWDAWTLIRHADVGGTRNSMDFEVIVIGNKLSFLVDNTVVYTSTRVSMTESTVKFTGYNVGTTTVENLSAQIFKSQQEAESYLASKG